MSRNIRLYLNDSMTSSDKILRYRQGMSFETFIADDRTVDAVLHNLQIIGEAAKNIPLPCGELRTSKVSTPKALQQPLLLLRIGAIAKRPYPPQPDIRLSCG